MSKKGGDKNTKHPSIELFGGLVVLEIRARFVLTLYHPFRTNKQEEVIMFTAKVGEKSKNLTFKVAIAIFAYLFVAILGPGLLNLDSSQALAKSRGGCKIIALDARIACSAEVNDDYWIAIGNCNNLPDRDERAECKQEAWAERKDAKEVCADQKEARKEVCEDLEEVFYNPDVLPENFVEPNTINSGNANRYFPLVVGYEWVYQGETDEGTETITVTVTDETKEIEYPEDSGNIFICRVVRDVVELDGEVIEDTDDWYAQAMNGDIWYFGEISQVFEDGELVELEGSWKAGKEGAHPGVLIQNDPQPENIYRQEYWLAEAEDLAEVISRDKETVTVQDPPVIYDDDVLKTKDFTPIEPDVFEYKYYAPGVGLLREEAFEDDMATGEIVELISKNF